MSPASPVCPRCPQSAAQSPPGSKTFLSAAGTPGQRRAASVSSRCLPRPGSCLLKKRQKMPLTTDPVGKQPHTLRHADARRKTILFLNLCQAHLRKRIQRKADASLILFLVKGAGRIQKPPARSQHPHCLRENLPLQRNIILRPALLIALYHPRIPAEHPLPRARSIDQNLVKKPRKTCGNPLRRLAQHTDIGSPEKLQILKQGLGPRSADIICKKDALSFKPRRQLRALPARGRAQIQHPLPGPDPQNRRRRHRARLLQIIKPRRIPRMPPGAHLLPVIKSVGNPCNPLKLPSGLCGIIVKCVRIRLQRIDAKSKAGGLRARSRVLRK